MEKRHMEHIKELEDKAEGAEAERVFIELELNNAKAERDEAEEQAGRLADKNHQSTPSSPIVAVPIASVSDFAPSELSQKFKAAQKEVRHVWAPSPVYKCINFSHFVLPYQAGTVKQTGTDAERAAFGRQEAAQRGAAHARANDERASKSTGPFKEVWSSP